MKSEATHHTAASERPEPAAAALLKASRDEELDLSEFAAACEAHGFTAREFKISTASSRSLFRLGRAQRRVQVLRYACGGRSYVGDDWLMRFRMDLVSGAFGAPWPREKRA